MNYKSLKISVDVHEKLKEYCKLHFLKVNEFANHIIHEWIKIHEKENESGGY